MSLFFGPYLTIPDLYEPDFDDSFKEKIFQLSDGLFSISDGSLAEEIDYDFLADLFSELGIMSPININSKEFQKFQKTTTKNFSKKYTKLINFLRKNDIHFGINFGIYDILY